MNSYTHEQAVAHLYDAECALHAARQSHVDAWISAASDKLHQAILELDAAAASTVSPSAA
jgi:hypothetical protein